MRKKHVLIAGVMMGMAVLTTSCVNQKAVFEKTVSENRVLKDFEESFSGDIDAGGYDLNLSFSIVGENPPPDRAGAYIKKESKKSLDEILGGKEPDLLNQTPKKKGGIIKLL